MTIHQVCWHESHKDHLFDFAVPYMNETLDEFFENSVISRLFTENQLGGGLCGVLSWKAKRKTERAGLTLGALDGYDICCLVRWQGDALGSGELHHPRFRYLMEPMLKEALGLNYNDYRKRGPGFFQNAVIAKEEIFKDYVGNWLIPCVEFLRNAPVDSDYRKVLWSDSHYRKTKKPNRPRIRGFLGQDHYPYHPFLLERLWFVYFAEHPGLKLFI